MSRRKKKAGPPRCNTCGALVTFFRLPSGEYAPFRTMPMRHRAMFAGRAYPIYAGRAWHLEDLVEELMARSSQSQELATEEAYALPWHVTHVCQTTTTETEE